MRSAPPADLVPDGYDGLLRTRALVLESGHLGPELCLGGVQESFPPQCGGPALPGWDWGAQPGGSYESAGGTTWGDYEVTGRLEGGAFVVERAVPAPPSTADPLGDAEDPFASPCPEPEGGWRPTDASRADEAALQRAVARAEESEHLGGVWLDQLLPVQADEPGAEPSPGSPQQLVLNVSTTGDPAALEAALREEWGGPLCVSRAQRTRAELYALQDELTGRHGALSSSVTEAAGQVELTVPVAFASLQEELDATHGEGVVRLLGVLRPAR
ncbi:hypothetical protein D5H78_17880 [Vallicoccus soli]|uniref:Uncharacterized protein n=1 Tax=Vallicoccus soli TaxID=2339232 RepID=A0A3A3YQR1_9ACTN|nr:hypothetical protein D5H78_17880 [Vallicoccus soli]